MRMLQSLLMAPGPFYFYPWKAPVNAAAGDDYAVGFKHFWTGHRHAVNLSLHCVCLFVQVFGNFGLLNAIDARYIPQPIAGVRVLSAASAIVWSLYLLVASKGCPMAARVGSAAALGLAYFLAPQITRTHMDVGAPAAMVAALLVSNFAIAKRKIPIAAVVRLIVVMGLWGTAWPAIEGAFVDRVLGGARPERTLEIIGGVAGYLGVLGLARNPLTALVLSGLLFTRLASAAAGGDSVLYFWSYAFAGSLFQGLTHRAVQEEATLLALERESEDAKLRFEWAHVTFFPTLLLHACIRAMSGGDAKKQKR